MTTVSGIPQGILVSDFDGTMTRFDFYDLACQAFPEIAGNFWQQYESGQITHFEGLKRIFSAIRAPEEKLLGIIQHMQLDPKLPDAVNRLQHHGWDVVVASAGCDWYIKRLLKDAGVSIVVHANPGEFTPSTGLLMHLPQESPFFSLELGVNKVAVVRDALKRCSRVAFAGDGRPDLAPALLVPPERRFAKSWLAKKLLEINEPFQPFEHWSDIPLQLARQENWA